MPPKFASLKPEEVIRALKKGGFYIHETSGSGIALVSTAFASTISFGFVSVGLRDMLKTLR